MKKKKTTILAMITTVITMMLFAGSAGAAISVGQSIGIDFANGPNTPGAGTEINWNLIIGNGSNIQAVDTSDGANIAGVKIAVAGFFDADCEMGESSIGFGVAGVGDYGTSPFSDKSYNDGIFSYNNPSTVTLSGLDDSLRYDVLVIPGASTNQNTTVPVTVDGATISRDYNSYRSGNVLSPASFDDVSTDGSGNLEILFGLAGGPYGVCAIYVTAVTTPVRALRIGDAIAVDMSSDAVSTANYNVFTISGTKAAGSVKDYATRDLIADVSITLLVDPMGGFTDASTTGNWGGTGGDMYYEQLIDDDIAFTANSGNKAIALTFNGLDNALAYNVRIYSLISGSVATEKFTVTGISATRVNNSARNVRWAAATLEDGGTVFAGVAPDGSGAIEVKVEGILNNAFLNAVVLEAVAREGGVFIIR